MTVLALQTLQNLEYRDPAFWMFGSDSMIDHPQVMTLTVFCLMVFAMFALQVYDHHDKGY